MPSPARHFLGQFAQPLEARIVPTFGLTGLLAPTAAGAEPVAAVAAGPRLLAADTAQSALLGGLLGALAGDGSAVALTAVDYDGLAAGDINLGSLLGRLQATTGAGTPAGALTADVTLGQLLTAAADAARADGAAAVADSLDAAAVDLLATGTVRLGDLLAVSLPGDAFARAEVNALDLLVGSVQLFNYENAVATTPVTLSGAALGPAAGSVGSVALQARVVEPPVFVVGPAGSRFHSAAVRLKLDVDLLDVSLDTAALLAPVRAALPGLDVGVAATVGRVQLFADVARGSGRIEAIDALTNAVVLRSTPAVADVYLGTIPDRLFLDRTRPVDPATDLQPGVVGTLRVTADSPLGSVLDLSLDLTARAAAEGAAVSPIDSAFAPAYPQARTVQAGAAVVDDLLASLLEDLEVSVSGDLGLLSGLAGTFDAALTGVAVRQLRPALDGLLRDVADPALGALGIGLGQLDLVVLGADSPDAPVAAADALTATAGVAVTLDVRANDTVQAGTTPTLTISVGPQRGTAAVNADGTITYTPAAGFVGTDTFTYTLTDAYGRTSSAVVTVQVNRPANRAPTTQPDAVSATAGQAVTFDVRSNDADADGDPLGVSVVTPPANGTAAVGADGRITYTPASGFVGVDAFTYAVSDGAGGTATGVVTVTVGRGPNTAPVAGPDAPTTAVGTPAVVAVLSNDTDADGDRLSVTAVTQPSRGTAVLQADGSITYTPQAGFRGVDAFTYSVADGFGGTATGVVTVVVGSAAGNAVPVVRADAVGTLVGVSTTIQVLANDTDADGDTLQVTLVAGPASGTAVVNADGSVTYTPAAGFVGTDTFTYAVADGFGGTATGTVTVTVELTANQSPTVRPDAPTTGFGAAVVVDVLANDTDPDGDALSVTGVTGPANGTAVVGADGRITYTPRPGFRGTDTFIYAASDGRGGTAEGTVTVSVGGNTAPAAGSDLLDTTAGTPATADLRANDADADGDGLTVTGVTQPANGTAVLDADGRVTYTPRPGFVGADAFSYTLADGFGGTATGVVTVTVGRGPNRVPSTGADTASTTAGTAVTVAVLGNDSDADGDRLVLTGVSQPADGTAVPNPDGTVTYTPRAGFSGTDRFTYTATDGFGGTSTGTVTVTVAAPPAPNASPTVAPDAVSTPVGTSVDVQVLANDADADGDPVSVREFTQPANGTVAPNSGGVLTYTPRPGFRGTDSFTYTASDGRGGTGTATVTVTVGTPAGDPQPPTDPQPEPQPPANPGPQPPATGTPPTPGTPPTSPTPGTSTPPAPTPPAGGPGRPFAVGADTTGGPRVTVYNPDGSKRFNFFAYDDQGRFGVDVAMADVTGDGVLDIVTGPQDGGGPHVKVFDGVTLALVHNFFAFEADFRGGVSVAAADVDGDGRADLIIGAGAGGGPRVRVFDGRSGAVRSDRFVFDPARRDGVEVDCADLDGDGRAELVASVGGSGPALTRGLDADTGAVLLEVAPFEPGYAGRASVAVADLSGDGRPELVFGAGPGGGPRVRVFDGATGRVTDDRFVYQQDFTGGVRVAAADLDGDGRAELLTGLGVGGTPKHQAREGVADPMADQLAFEEEFRGGVLLG